MTFLRSLLVFAITLASLSAAQQSAEAQDLNRMFGAIGHKLKVQTQAGLPRVAKHGFGIGHQGPGSFPHPRPFPRPNPGCFPKPPGIYPPPPVVCPPRPCPPPPVCYRYCVYYFHHAYGWRLYRCYNSQWSARAAQRSMQQRGFRTYVKRIRANGGPVVGPWVN